MKTRFLGMQIGWLLLAVGVYCQEPALHEKPIENQITPLHLVTPLSACSSVPTTLPEDLHRWYRDFCLLASPAERNRALIDLRRLQESEAAILLPLFSELMTTEESDCRERRRFYVAAHAAEDMSMAGVDAVPFIIKALKSEKSIEVHAGLHCIEGIVMQFEHFGRTNELRPECSNLLPYVSIQITNPVPEKIPTEWMYGTITNEAKLVEYLLKRFLPQPSSTP